MNYRHSTFNSPVHRSMKQLGIKDKSEESFNEIAWKCCAKLAETHGVKDMHLFAAEVYSSYLWKYKQCHHYFLDDGIADFCVSSVKELSRKFYKPLPEPDTIAITNHPQWMKATIVVNDDYTLKAGIAIHFPSRERLKSIMLVQDFAVRHSVKIGYNPNYGEKHLCSIVNGEDILLTQVLKDGEIINCSNSDEGQVWINKLVFGLGLYVDAFPDAVTTTGAIGQVVTTHRPKCFNVSKSEIMKSENVNAVSPHYRRGHFRLLQDERYKKKGQSIFIKGSFVKGQAFDVE